MSFFNQGTLVSSYVLFFYPFTFLSLIFKAGQRKTSIWCKKDYIFMMIYLAFPCFAKKKPKPNQNPTSWFYRKFQRKILRYQNQLLPDLLLSQLFFFNGGYLKHCYLFEIFGPFPGTIFSCQTDQQPVLQTTNSKLSSDFFPIRVCPHIYKN